MLAATDWKTASFSQIYRPYLTSDQSGDPALPSDLYDFYTHMGFSVRTKRFRYTEWPRFDYVSTHEPDWDDNQLAGVELYDYERDPGGERNVASDPEYGTVAKEMRERLRRGWRRGERTGELTLKAT